ncbi:DUF262 domain-containing protein [Rhodococcus qingshengii]|uniref:DUF262 domain-containing protein n=1 Tax=Rhodococcus TaxID=1827 RepID=UPI001BAF85E8|nr:DUF262 domain-containing protein [Rhodococcus qingshengii]MBS3695249.1 DUF262 domain-containing protein [Rhodococcus qingshengii]
METPVNASSTTAGSLLSGGRFYIPPFQREYAWEGDQVEEFFRDISHSLKDDSYFLGLVILTESAAEKSVVDGQQRILTLTLLAAAIYHKAFEYERNALADRIRTTFLYSIDFESDKEYPRVRLASERDNATLAEILNLGQKSNIAAPKSLHTAEAPEGEESASKLMIDAYKLLNLHLTEDISEDQFRKLGTWADFITNKLYFAVFNHPNPSSAYKVFEIVNTRGRALTTADLLKSYTLSETPEDRRDARYHEWQDVSRQFDSGFVTYIRHAITTTHGYIPPRDLYDALTGRGGSTHGPTNPEILLQLLQLHLPIYLQMMDPTTAGPATEDELAVFTMLNTLNVVSMRPILLAIRNTPMANEGRRELLKLVVRRSIVGNLGTGSIERRFGEVAAEIHRTGSWEKAISGLADLNPEREEFVERAHRRPMNKNTLSALRASALQGALTPNLSNTLYFIRTRGSDWDSQNLATTLGNTFLATESRRPMGSSTWDGFKENLLPLAAEGELSEKINSFKVWDGTSISMLGEIVAIKAAEVWYE